MSYIITVLYWWMGLSAEVAVILVFGIRVNEKVRARLLMAEQSTQDIFYVKAVLDVDV